LQEYLRLQTESAKKMNLNISKNKKFLKIKNVLEELKQILVKLYGFRLYDIIIYGSYARREERKDSDIDIAVILKGEVKLTEELNRLIDATYDLELKHKLFFSFRPISLERYLSEGTSLFINIKEEGISI